MRLLYSMIVILLVCSSVSLFGIISRGVYSRIVYLRACGALVSNMLQLRHRTVAPCLVVYISKRSRFDASYLSG